MFDMVFILLFRMSYINQNTVQVCVHMKIVVQLFTKHIPAKKNNKNVKSTQIFIEQICAGIRMYSRYKCCVAATKN